MINNKEIMMIVDTVSNEKGLPRDVVVEIVEEALATATRRQLGVRDLIVQVKLDPETGDYVVHQYYAKEPELLEEYGAFKRIPFEKLTCEEIPPMSFSRIAAQTAKQTIHQRIKDAEKRQQMEDMNKRLGQMMAGTVKKVFPDVLHISNSEDLTFLLPSENLLFGEHFRIGDRVRAVLSGINTTPRGNNFILSRTSAQMLEQLMRSEIPEIDQGIVQIKAIARDPGIRAKVAVKTNDRRIDPVGVCIGMHGIRIQAVSAALGGERIDVVEWSDDIAQLVVNLMLPVKVGSLYVNEVDNCIDVVVGEGFLAQSIGRNGVNVQLSSQICGWRINVLTEEESSSKKLEEAQKLLLLFIEQLSVDEDLAKKLVDGKVTSVEELAFLPIEELMKMGLDEEQSNAVRDTANDVLLMQQLSEQLQQSQAEVEAEDSLRNLAGVTSDILIQLVKADIRSAESLAELASDELLEILPNLSEEQINKLIMEARRPWFE